MLSIIDVTRPLQRATEPEIRRENVSGSSQVAAPPLPASSSLNLLVRTSESMPSIADRAFKRHQKSLGGEGRQLTMLAAAPLQVALEPAVVVRADIEHNRQAIVAGVAPSSQAICRQKETESKHHFSAGGGFQRLQAVSRRRPW